MSSALKKYMALVTILKHGTIKSFFFKVDWGNAVSVTFSAGAVQESSGLMSMRTLVRRNSDSSRMVPPPLTLLMLPWHSTVKSLGSVL